MRRYESLYDDWRFVVMAIGDWNGSLEQKVRMGGWVRRIALRLCEWDDGE